ncbi:MAG: ComEA family DNA-binding protein [Bradymonadaceae bacterium]
MFRLIVTLSAFGIVFGACSDELPTAQQAVAQTTPATSPDDSGEAPSRNPEKHDIYPRSESESVAGDKSSSTGNEKSDDGEDALQGVVNLNDASAEQLQKLPGVGPTMASRIVTYRDKRRFEKPVHIKRVRGIGDVTYQKLEEHLAVEGDTTLSE